MHFAQGEMSHDSDQEGLRQGNMRESKGCGLKRKVQRRRNGKIQGLPEVISRVLGVLQGKVGCGGREKGEADRGFILKLKHYLLLVMVGSPKGGLRGEIWAGPIPAMTGVRRRLLHPVI